MKPLVSAIIPNYNYAKYVGEAVESALSQTYENEEIIVVDDGSKDDSLQRLSAFGDKIKVIAQENAGVSASRNNGVRAAKGEYIAFLDADDVWLPEKLERQVAAFEGRPDVGLVHVGVQDIDGNGVRGKVHDPGMEGSVARDLLLFERPVILGGGSGVMIRRSLYDEVGGFDVRLSTSADWDLYFQLCSISKVLYVDEVLLLYRVHGSNMHGNIRAMEHDTLIGWQKAFELDGFATDNDLRRQAYANLHRTLGASFFRAGDYWNAARNLAKSLRLRPMSFFGRSHQGKSANAL